MIELDVMDYCHGCLEFVPVADTTEVLFAKDAPYFGSIYVRCKHSALCRHVFLYLKTIIEKENGDTHGKRQTEN